MCGAVFGHQSWGLEIHKFLDLTLKLGFAGALKVTALSEGTLRTVPEMLCT